jgi:hypothetical protein
MHRNAQEAAIVLALIALGQIQHEALRRHVCTVGKRVQLAFSFRDEQLTSVRSLDQRHWIVKGDARESLYEAPVGGELEPSRELGDSVRQAEGDHDRHCHSSIGRGGSHRRSVLDPCVLEARVERHLCSPGEGVSGALSRASSVNRVMSAPQARSSTLASAAGLGRIPCRQPR